MFTITGKQNIGKKTFYWLKRYLRERFQRTELFALINPLQFKTCIFYKNCKQKLMKPTTCVFFLLKSKKK